MQAGVFEPPPSDNEALADTMGLMLNCINSGLCEPPFLSPLAHDTTQQLSDRA